jgi:putative addiction module component (TIGR02574 family)
MNVTREYINEIKNLSVPEKILLVEEIWDSIAADDVYPELPESDLIELEARMNSFHANPKQGRTWNEIKNDFWQSK